MTGIVQQMQQSLGSDGGGREEPAASQSDPLEEPATDLSDPQEEDVVIHSPQVTRASAITVPVFFLSELMNSQGGFVERIWPKKLINSHGGFVERTKLIN